MGIQSQVPALNATGTVVPASLTHTDTRPLSAGEGKSYHSDCTNKWPAPFPEFGSAKEVKIIKKRSKMLQDLKFSLIVLNFLPS